MSRGRLAALAVGAYLLGVAVMVPFEGFPWRLIGMLLMTAAAAAGLLAILTPADLARDVTSEERGDPPSS